MTHRFPWERRAVLRSPERYAATPPESILRSVGLVPGQTVADVGAGTGFWAEAAASIVGPEGLVYALDIVPQMLEDLRALDLPNLQVLASTEQAIPLPDAVADLVILAMLLHEVTDQDLFLRDARRLLKSNGQIFLVDWEDHPTESGPPLEVRVSREMARALLGNAGLTVEDFPSPTGDLYMLLARDFHPGDPQQTGPTI